MAEFGRSEAARATWAAKNVKEKQARADETFSVIPPMKGDAIKAQSIFKELQKSEIGKTVYNFIVDDHIPVEISYTKDYEAGVRGYTFGNSVVVNARVTKTVKATVKTIIHEATHVRLNTPKSTQWEEAYCFAQETKHDNPQLTYSDLRDIIKTVRKLYPEYSWR